MTEKAMSLSPEESAFLAAQVRALNESFSTALKVLPVLILLTVVCWVFNWYSILKFIFSISSLALTIGLVALYFKTQKINKDVAANTKAVERFFLEKRFVEGYVKTAGESGTRSTGQTKRWARSIILTDEVIRHAIDYKRKMKGANKVEQVMQQSTIDDEMLNYTYKYRMKDSRGRLKVMEVPIELYLAAREGEEVEIGYAPNSQIVFDVNSNSSVRELHVSNDRQ